MYNRKRSTHVVTIDLDPVPGWGNDPSDHEALIRRQLEDSVSHYEPVVVDMVEHIAKTVAPWLIEAGKLNPATWTARFETAMICAGLNPLDNAERGRFAEMLSVHDPVWS